METEKFLDRAQAAALLTERGFRTSPRSLAKWASTGGGPRYRRFGVRAVYCEADLMEWANSRLSQAVGSTAELSG